MSLPEAVARHRESLAAWTMVAPALLVTLVFALYPVLDSFWLSLHHIFVGIPSLGRSFIGLRKLSQPSATIRSPTKRCSSPSPSCCSQPCWN